MLYETAARASEILALDIADLDLDGRRAKERRLRTHLDRWSAYVPALPGLGVAGRPGARSNSSSARESLSPRGAR
jgi:integrase